MKRPKLFEISIEPNTLTDFETAFSYYDNISMTLSENFKLRFEYAIYKLSTGPYNYFKLTKRLRRIKLGKFPYMIVYKIHRNKVIVAGLFHQASKPSKW